MISKIKGVKNCGHKFCGVPPTLFVQGTALGKRDSHDDFSLRADEGQGKHLYYDLHIFT